MPKRTAWLHVGLPGTGAPTLATALATHAEALRAQGFALPASPEQALRAALELRREHKGWGYRRREVEGAWADVCRRAHRGRRHPLVVGELLAACDPSALDLLLDGLAPMRVEVVVNVRDPAAQVLDAWAETVRLGRTVSFASYAERLLDPAREHAQSRRFWAAQHVGEVLARWGEAVGPERVHLVVLPHAPDGAGGPGALEAAWAGLGRATGLDVAGLPLPAHAARSLLDPAGVAVAREANRAVDGRIEVGAHRREVAPWLATALAQEPAAHPRLPRDLHDVLDRLAATWRDQVVAAGHPVHGDLGDLRPAEADPAAPLPDDVPTEVRLALATEALADALVEVARLRRHQDAHPERAAGVRGWPRTPARVRVDR